MQDLVVPFLTYGSALIMFCVLAVLCLNLYGYVSGTTHACMSKKIWIEVTLLLVPVLNIGLVLLILCRCAFEYLVEKADEAHVLNTAKNLAKAQAEFDELREREALRVRMRAEYPDGGK